VQFRILIAMRPLFVRFIGRLQLRRIDAASYIFEASTISISSILTFSRARRFAEQPLIVRDAFLSSERVYRANEIGKSLKRSMSVGIGMRR
jgi:hypothetical protein